jgi:hypothetical protein
VVDTGNVRGHSALKRIWRYSTSKEKDMVTVDKLIASLEAFLRENPSWDQAEVVVVANCLIVQRGSELRRVDLEETD